MGVERNYLSEWELQPRKVVRNSSSFTWAWLKR